MAPSAPSWISWLETEAEKLGLTVHAPLGCVSDTLARLRHYGVPGEAVRLAFVAAEDGGFQRAVPSSAR